MLNKAEKLCRFLWFVSLYGLALFIPFSIAGSNICIFLGFIGSLVAMAVLPEWRRRYALMLRDPLLWAGLVLTLSALPSVFMSENFDRAMKDWRSYWLILIYLYVAYTLDSPGRRRRVFWTLFGSMCLSCIVVLIQRTGGIHIGFIDIGPQTDRPSSTMFTMTFAGVLYQVITVSFAVLLAHRWRSRDGRILVGGLLLQVAAQLVNLTRGAWVALAGGIFAVPAFSRRWRLLLLGIVVAVVAVGGAVQNTKIRNRVMRAVNYANNPTDKHIGTRLTLWDISIEMFKERPWLGLGMGDYSEEAKRRLAERNVTTVTDSHNIYLQILATRGLVGFVPFVAFWVVLFYVLLQSRRRAGPSRYAYNYISGALAVAVAILIGALSENNLDDSEVFIAFMFIVGFARSFAITPDQRDS